MLTNPISLFSQSLFSLSLDQAIATTVELGFEAIELACVAPHFDKDTAIEDPEKTAASIADSGLKVSALSLFNNFTDEGLAQVQIAEADRYIRLAPLFQSSIVKITPGPPGSAQANASHWWSFYRALDHLIPVAEETGVRLACETHMRQLTDNLAGTCKLLGAFTSESLGLTVDFSNMRFAGETMAEVFGGLASRMYNVHVKNGIVAKDGSWRFMALDSGWTDYGEVIELLAASDYDGYLTVECLGEEARNRPAETAARDLDLLKSYMGRNR